ncbi:T-box transcription factor tbx1 [Chamberlinius hualienensis]
MRYLPYPHSNDPRITAELDQKELWEQFHKNETEMIITKPGRRMFPAYKVKMEGLEAKQQYHLMLEMAPVDQNRYKYQNFQWVIAGGAEPQPYRRTCIHPDSPALGAHWMSQPISFYKMKLTNNMQDQSPEHIVLNSMHKYVPLLHVYQAVAELRTGEHPSMSNKEWKRVATFTFREAEFVAVTAYQNEVITKLKIENNPFAKGFRETEDERKDRKKSKSILKKMDGDTDSSSDDESIKNRDEFRDRSEVSMSDINANSKHDIVNLSTASGPSVPMETYPYDRNLHSIKMPRLFQHTPPDKLIPPPPPLPPPLINTLLPTVMPYNCCHSGPLVPSTYYYPRESLLCPGCQWMRHMPLEGNVYRPYPFYP